MSLYSYQKVLGHEQNLHEISENYYLIIKLFLFQYNTSNPALLRI